MSPTRAAMTLIEVVIASAILLTALAITLEVMVASRQLESNVIAKDTTATDAERVLKVIADDLSLSGWLLPQTEDINNDGTVQTTEYLVNNDAVIDPVVYAAVTPAQDRTAWYYPYIQIQDATGTQDSGLGARFPWIHRPASAVRLPWSLDDDPPGDPLLHPSLPGEWNDAVQTFDFADAAAEERWVRSFTARSQEPIFLRSTVGAWNTIDEEFRLAAPEAGAYATTERISFSNQSLNFDINPATGLTLSRSDWLTPGNHARLGVLFPSGWLPRDASNDIIDGNGTVMGPSQIIDFVESTPGRPYGVVLDGGWYDPDADGNDQDLAIKIQWETIDAATLSPEDYYQNRLREYTYAVVPSPIGLGRLVRAHKVVEAGQTVGYELGNVLPVRNSGSAGNWRMQVDRVVSDNVVRLVVDTYRTVDRGRAGQTEDADGDGVLDPGEDLNGNGTIDALGVISLAPNQVRIRVYTAVRQVTNPNQIIVRHAEAVVGMRARSSAADIATIQAQLGTRPIGIER